MPRFYIEDSLIQGQTLQLSDATVRHIQALRLRDGATITLFNGRGGEWSATVQILGRRDICAQISAHNEIERESPLQITLIQGVSMGDRMDYTLQKAVELGVSHIQPVISERSARIPADRLNTRQEHWRKVVESACEQSGRNTIPSIATVCSWKQWLPIAPKQGLLLSPLGSTTISQLPQPEGGISLLAGPEGGLNTQEEQDVLQLGWTPITLGPRILRTETAALAALAALQTLWGDYSHV